MSVSIHSLPAAQRNAALQGLRRAGLGRRVYEFGATRAGGRQVLVGPVGCVSDARIRQVLLNRFRAVFGGAPSFSWAADGRLGEAWDDRGNRLHIEQINNLPPG